MGQRFAATLVHVDDQVMLITDRGVLERESAKFLLEMGTCRG
jgi:hypothetical protein